MFKNKEIKSVLLKLIIFQVVFALLGGLLINTLFYTINKQIVERDTALVGRIIKEHPELKEKVIPYITKGVEKEDIKEGEMVLEAYGYDDTIHKSQQAILKDLTPRYLIYAFLLIFSFLIPLGWIILSSFREIYGKINKISLASQRVVEGDFSIHLKEEGEGDFNILSHHFNEMSNRLDHVLGQLKNEKILLKNSLSDISHQLKTPLSSLIVFNDLLIKDENMDPQSKIQFLQKSKSQLERMEWLIINLLKVARIEAGAITFERERFYLKQSLDIALQSLSESLTNIKIEVKGDMETSLYGDKNWIAEALINIIKNATEHGGENITITLEESPIFTTIVIKDNGEGIDPQHLPHIFERFYKTTSKIKPNSIGIGLNLAKLIVEAQKGSISVQSRKDTGTSFTITFLKGVI